ncbi:MAG: ribonuclease III [Alphaproteobacteria bacterium]|nr:ribonuclease III [Alphaproteobacteria bacterium]
MTGRRTSLSDDLRELAASLGHDFRNDNLLTTALTHASAGGDAGAPAGPSYERLEFLGDRVLGLIVAERLLERFPTEAEGEIAKRHAALVSRDVLAEIARRLGVGAHIRLAVGARADGVADNPGILADTLEALIAALYLDGGIEPARSFIRRYWAEPIEADIRPPRDAKSRLQEWAMARGRPLPKYSEVSRKGPPHQPIFTIEVTLNGVGTETGLGSSKRVAEQAAAEALFERLERDEP